MTGLKPTAPALPAEHPAAEFSSTRRSRRRSRGTRPPSSAAPSPTCAHAPLGAPMRSTAPRASRRSEGISNKRNLNEVLPMLATNILFLPSTGPVGPRRARACCRASRRESLLGLRGLAREELAQPGQVLVRARDHVHRDHLADRRGRRRPPDRRLTAATSPLTKVDTKPCLSSPSR
jgi:hypothetical protein